MRKKIFEYDMSINLKESDDENSINNKINNKINELKTYIEKNYNFENFIKIDKKIKPVILVTNVNKEIEKEFNINELEKNDKIFELISNISS